MELKTVPVCALNAFPIGGSVTGCVRYGGGHINDTFKVDTEKERYIFQRINTHVFKKPDELMHNIFSTTKHIRSKVTDPRGCLDFMKTVDGQTFYDFTDEEGNRQCWRAYHFIDHVVCLNLPENAEDFYQSAVGFGKFQRELADFPADTLFETIPNFHNTRSRYENFKKALAEDKVGRAASVQKEIDFYLSEEADGVTLVELLQKGELPLRVTHNDTKLNNVLLDEVTRKALCVIDLDTIMPGLSLYDFGDSIRFGASTAAEDEQDLSKVWMDIGLFRRYSEGFLASCGKSLTEKEIEMLPMGAKIMTLECGLRFLTDYLEGDVYFRIHDPEQNLWRARTHVKLVQDMERQWADMHKAVQESR